MIDVDNGKYMNHSLAPNTDFRIFDKGYALADIARGDDHLQLPRVRSEIVGFMPDSAAAVRVQPLNATAP